MSDREAVPELRGRLVRFPDDLNCLVPSSGSDLHEKDRLMRYIALWALGVPISGIIILHLFGII